MRFAIYDAYFGRASRRHEYAAYMRPRYADDFPRGLISTFGAMPTPSATELVAYLRQPASQRGASCDMIAYRASRRYRRRRARYYAQFTSDFIRLVASFTSCMPRLAAAQPLNSCVELKHASMSATGQNRARRSPWMSFMLPTPPVSKKKLAGR